MGTVTMGNDGVERRIDDVGDKVSENTSALKDGFNSLLCLVKNGVNQLRLLNLRTQEAFETCVEEDDVDEV